MADWDDVDAVAAALREYHNVERLTWQQTESISAEAKKLIAKSKRDGFWKTLRWTRYAMPVPRLFHKAEIKRALKYDEEYNWDEAGAGTIEQGICEWLWD